MRWRIFQFPYKFSSDHNRLRWSKTLESIRKDVECTFGIMKRRFRILRTPVEYRQPVRIEQLFKTCCHLHNRLLVHDGLDTIGDLESDWLAADLTPIQRSNEEFKLAAFAERYKSVTSVVDRRLWSAR